MTDGEREIVREIEADARDIAEGMMTQFVIRKGQAYWTRTGWSFKRYDAMRWPTPEDAEVTLAWLRHKWPSEEADLIPRLETIDV